MKWKIIFLMFNIPNMDSQKHLPMEHFSWLMSPWALPFLGHTLPLWTVAGSPGSGSSFTMHSHGTCLLISSYLNFVKIFLTNTYLFLLKSFPSFFSNRVSATHTVVFHGSPGMFFL